MVNADDIAQLARSIVGPTANEVRIRCGVSRAYYAAFHFCSNAANLWCNPLTADDKKDKGSHAQIYYQLQALSKDESTKRSLKLMAAEAQKLRDLRVESDYTLTSTVDMGTYTRSLSLMAQVKKYFDSIAISQEKPAEE